MNDPRIYIYHIKQSEESKMTNAHILDHRNLKIAFVRDIYSNKIFLTSAIYINPYVNCSDLKSSAVLGLCDEGSAVASESVEISDVLQQLVVVHAQRRRLGHG